jgi:hypothetical protein
LTLQVYALGASLYFGELIIQHPFVNARTLNKKYSPVEIPSAYRPEVLKSIVFFFTVIPMVERGLVNFDSDLSLRHCVEIKAISHRADRCRLYSPNCTEANGTVWENGARTLAYVLARDLTRVRHCFVQPTERGEQQLGSTVRDTIKFLLDELTPEEPHGPISSERRSDAILVGALLLYGSGQLEDAQEAVRVLASRDTARCT